MNFSIFLLIIQICAMVLIIPSVLFFLKKFFYKGILTSSLLLYLLIIILFLINEANNSFKNLLPVFLLIIFISFFLYIILFEAKKLKKFILKLNSIKLEGGYNTNNLSINNEFGILVKPYIKITENLQSVSANITSFSLTLDNKMSALSKQSLDLKKYITEQEAQIKNFNNIIELLSSSIEIGAKGLDDTRIIFKKMTENFNVLFENMNTLLSQNLNIQNENENMDQHSMSAIKFTIDLKEVTKDGTEKMDNIIGFIRNMVSSVKKITEMVTLIKKITAQTNLLAINASIEAAHAGTAGHGFAVVANEIHSLADSSVNATEKINNIVQTILEDIEKGHDYSKNAKKGIEDINEAFNKNIDFISDLANSINQQIKNTSDVKVNIDRIYDLSKNINEASKYQQKRLQETYQATENLNSQTLIIRQFLSKEKTNVEKIMLNLKDLENSIEEAKKYTESLPILINGNK